MLIELDEGYSFGLGLFETILLYKGKPVFLDEHLARINKVEDIIGQNSLLELIYKKIGDKTLEIPKMTLEDIENFETIMKFLNNIFMEIQGK